MEAVPDDFPDINILVQYIEPLTSWSNTNGREYQPVGVVQSCQADFVRLAAICEACFEWSSMTIQAKFRADLWKGACMHALCQVGLHSSLGLLFNASHTSCLNAQVGVTTSPLKSWSMFPHFGTVLWQPTRCTSPVHCSSLQPILELESTQAIAGSCPMIAAQSTHA